MILDIRECYGYGAPVRKAWALTVGPLQIDSLDWSLSWSVGGRCWRQLFALRCGCGRWTMRCRDHWFCGLCEPCRSRIEDQR